MTARSGGSRGPWYRDLLLVSGFVLLILGIGNWATGAVRLREQAAGASRVPAMGAERSRGLEAAISAEIEVARVRMDFYHVVTSGGRLLTAAGIVVLAFGLARHLRPEARRS